MKVVFLLLLSLTSFAEADYLFQEGSYEVIGKVSKINKVSVQLDVFKDTTSQSSITLKNIKNLKLGKITIKLCVEIDKKCNWKCSGKLIKVIKPIEPWNKITLKKAIKKVENCL